MLGKKILFGIIYILVSIYLIIFIPCIFGYKPLIIESGSMEPILKVGGILYYKSIPLNNYKINNILVYKIPNHIVSHRIVGKNDYYFITKGDQNKINDSNVYNNQVLGRSSNFSIPYIGYYADYIYHHIYLLIITLFIVIIDYIIERRKNVKDN